MLFALVLNPYWDHWCLAQIVNIIRNKGTTRNTMQSNNHKCTYRSRRSVGQAAPPGLRQNGSSATRRSLLAPLSWKAWCWSSDGVSSTSPRIDTTNNITQRNRAAWTAATRMTHMSHRKWRCHRALRLAQEARVRPCHLHVPAVLDHQAPNNEWTCSIVYVIALLLSM